MLHHLGCRPGPVVVDDVARPELPQRARVREQEEQCRAGESGGRQAKTAPQEPEGGREDGHGRQFHGQRRGEGCSGRDGCDRPGKRREPGCEQHQRECRCVGDDLGREQVEGRRNGQKGRGQDPPARTAEAPADEPAADRAQHDHAQHCHAQIDHADAGDVRQAAQQIVKTRELSGEDVGAESLPVAQRVDGREVDILVVVRCRVKRPGKEEALCGDDDREQRKLERAGPCHVAERTIGGGDRRRDLLLGEPCGSRVDPCRVSGVRAVPRAHCSAADSRSRPGADRHRDHRRVQRGDRDRAAHREPARARLPDGQARRSSSPPTRRPTAPRRSPCSIRGSA